MGRCTPSTGAPARHRRASAPPASPTRRGTRCAPSGCAGSPCRCSRPDSRRCASCTVTDLHLTPGQRRKQAWVRDLAALEPDLVVDTGDNLAHLRRRARRAVRARAAARAAGRVRLRLQRLLRARRSRTRCATSWPTTARRDDGRRAAVARPARRACATAGWADLDQRPGARSRSAAARSSSSASTTRTCGATATTPSPAPPTADADLRLGVIHAPVPPGARPRWPPTASRSSSPGTPTAASCACPCYGALVTNCDLDPRRARGLSAARPTSHAAARLRRPRHLAVRPGPLRLPARGHAADPGRRATDRSRGRAPVGRPAAARLSLPGHLGVWRSLVARFVRDEEVVGSNPATPTGSSRCLCRSEAPAGVIRGQNGPLVTQVVTETARTVAVVTDTSRICLVQLCSRMSAATVLAASASIAGSHGCRCRA